MVGYPVASASLTLPVMVVMMVEGASLAVPIVVVRVTVRASPAISVRIIVVIAPPTAKVAEHVEATEKEPAPPEWIGDPVIEILIFPRRRVVSYDRRSILAVDQNTRSRIIKIGMVF